MEQQRQIFFEFEEKLSKFVHTYQNLNEEKKIAELEREQLKEKLTKSVLKNRELKDENERLKMVNAMLGEKEHRRLMKIKINRLIKEVDQCIVQLKR